MTVGEFRLRIEYAKAGRGAFLSHLEVLHSIERVIRRAELPFATTQGFHPHMKISFGPALPVGIGSESEFVDVYLTQYLEPELALSKLQAAAPVLLPIKAVGYRHKSEKSLSAALVYFSYRARVIAPNINADTVLESFNDISTREELCVEQKGKSKFYDPRQSIGKDVSVEAVGDDLEIIFDIRVSPHGALRAAALIELVFENCSSNFSHLEIVRIGTYIVDDDTQELVRAL